MLEGEGEGDEKWKVGSAKYIEREREKPVWILKWVDVPLICSRGFMDFINVVIFHEPSPWDPLTFLIFPS